MSQGDNKGIIERLNKEYLDKASRYLNGLIDEKITQRYAETAKPVWQSCLKLTIRGAVVLNALRVIDKYRCDSDATTTLRAVIKSIKFTELQVKAEVESLNEGTHQMIAKHLDNLATEYEAKVSNIHNPDRK